MHFIGNFSYLTDQEASAENERRHGNFSMIVEADTTEQALDFFRQRLVSFRTSSTLFSGHCTIFITQLLEFEQFPKEEAVSVESKIICRRSGNAFYLVYSAH